MKSFIIDPPPWFIILSFGSSVIILYGGITAFLFGAFIWTFWEYANHRWIFHKLFVAHHRVHHIDPRSHISLPLFVSVPGAYLFAIILEPSCLSGFLAGYIVYEIAHRIELSWHLEHHKDSNRYFGVTTPLWDYFLWSFISWY